MFLGTRTKCFLDDSREEEACRESRTSNQPILPIQTCPVFTLSTRFRRIIILILRKSRDAHFHFADSPSRYTIDRNFVPKISFSLLLRLSFVSSLRIFSFEFRGVRRDDVSGQDRERNGRGREEESKRQERYRA